MQNNDSDYIVVGKISGVFGVKGWVKVRSYTEPTRNILSYSPWYLRNKTGWQVVDVKESRQHGGIPIAQLGEIRDRDQALLLRGTEIAISHAQLPKLSADEYYWSELTGLAVRTVDNIDLGTVARVMATGSNDVLVVAGDRERLIPYIREQVIKTVDLVNHLIVVDWDPDF